MIEDLDSFLIHTDDGEVLRVLVIRSRIDTSTYEGQSSIPGHTELQLEDGRHLNRIDDDTFQIVETGQRVKRKY